MIAVGVVVFLLLISPETVAAKSDELRRSDETRTMRKSDRIVEGVRENEI